MVDYSDVGAKCQNRIILISKYINPKHTMTYLNKLTQVGSEDKNSLLYQTLH